MLWFGSILVLTLVAAGLVGARFGLTNTATVIAQLALVFLVLGLPASAWLLDAQLARRLPALQSSRFFCGLLAALRRAASIAYPRRLVLPVLLTLQSNTRPLAFIATLIVAVVVIFGVGYYRTTGWRTFTVSTAFTYLPDDAIADGFRSAMYEDMASPRGRFRAWPRISSFEQRGSFVRLFLPYHPLRDDIPLDKLCVDGPPKTSPAACLGRLWSISLGGRALPMDEFVVAERDDLRMRGLLGLVPTDGLSPGLHELTVVWNPQGNAVAPLDDRYSAASYVYRVFFAFAPDYELSLENRTASQLPR